VRGGSNYLNTEDWDWRRVPQVSLVPPDRTGRKMAIAAGLVLLFIIEVGVGLFFYLDKRAAEADLAAQIRVQTSAQSQVSALQGDIRDTEARIVQLEQQLLALEATPEVPVIDIAWGPALAALAALENSEVQFGSLATESSGRVVLQGTSESVGAIARFQSDLQVSSGLIELVSLQWKGEATGVTFEAILQVKPNDVAAGS